MHGVKMLAYVHNTTERTVEAVAAQSSLTLLTVRIRYNCCSGCHHSRHDRHHEIRCGPR